MELSYMKLFPAEGPSQSLLGTIPKIRAFTHADDIDAIESETFGHAYRTMADPAKWDPRTRETADHSLPYVLTVGIVDGDVTRASFTPERILDTAVLRLGMVRPDERKYLPGIDPNLVEIRLPPPGDPCPQQGLGLVAPGRPRRRACLLARPRPTERAAGDSVRPRRRARLRPPRRSPGRRIRRP